MKMRSVFFSFVLAGVAAALAACNGNNSGGGYVGPSPGPTCGPYGISSQLIYPPAGATGVSDSIPQMVVALSTPLPINTYNLALTGNNFSSLTANYLSQISASQLPSGSATTTIPNPTYEAVNLIAALPSATQISVALNIPSDPNNCTPQNIPNGTFTSQ
ncbi:MAG: hypothetical protein M3R51_06995 [Candidatus Eremiobacteraeota bacterium]|nr:hypothetical protein [Candidatus Eremiobacteraeota bacterium]